MIHRGVVPGISVLAARDDRIHLNLYLGRRALEPVIEPLENDTLYDLASLTKPLVTAFLVLHLIEKGALDLDTAVQRLFPALPAGMTIRHLLTHTSGLPAWYPFYLTGDDCIDQITRLPLESRPGTRVNYSCPGYILLYHVVNHVAGTAFADLARRVILQPLGLRRTFFKVPENLVQETAPTEVGNGYERALAERQHPEAAASFPWRTNVIRGETHDANSHWMGGTAGNAGLFSTLGDLYTLSREFFPDRTTLLRPETAGLFWKNETPFKAAHRTAGFKMNSSLITSGGRALARDAIGHSGFTGTSIWLEPRTRAVFIILSNRIHPHHRGHNFNRIRRRLHRLIRSDLGI